MALELQKNLSFYNIDSPYKFQMRIGIHTGPVVAGVIGFKKFSYDVWGDTVNTASRMEANGIAGEIQVSEDVFNLAKNIFCFEQRGKINIKGKGEMQTFLLKSKN